MLVPILTYVGNHLRRGNQTFLIIEKLTNYLLLNLSGRRVLPPALFSGFDFDLIP